MLIRAVSQLDQGPDLDDFFFFSHYQLQHIVQRKEGGVCRTPFAAAAGT